MIPWKNPEKDLPQVDSIIWILDQHHKAAGALSCEILGFQVREVKTDLIHALVAENMDYIGTGWRQFVLKEFNAKDERWKDDRPLAWCYQSELNFPPWIRHKSGQ